MNDTTNLLLLYPGDNSERYNEVKKYLMMPITEIVELLVIESDAKNKAFRFIEEKGLTYEFEAY